ncbi:toll/interleukin-1 receptor domain-containing protein [Membranihabitans maritimus]|uniref:toll/interleukin-1 receptor domain-containing protein n=1 Tax=Membranihabitans maritimus TaxID=2904244 RepID=UPI001F456772|nr:toll/interleukin-1 receptor domain-containing protein [Membranihabitans maritimus]
MSQKYKYQLIILGDPGSVADEITKLFFSSVEDLKMPPDSFEVITRSDFSQAYSGNQPGFVVYFGNKQGHHKDLSEIDSLISEGAIILPVFYDSFKLEIPKSLKNQNGLKYDDSQKQKIVNLALESYGKLRSSRKVFISYKRNESTSVAIQLYEALEKSNFDVFLDTHSIKQGEPFQEELWHRMSDSDVIVILNTPGFLDSEWCKEEIAEANAKQIGVIQLIWPGHKMEDTNEVCIPYQLRASDFEDGIFQDKDHSRLQEYIVRGISSGVESLRARNLASRQDSLITEFLIAANKAGKSLQLQPERIITEDLGSNRRRLFVPSVGVPQSMDCNQSEEIKKEIADYEVDQIHLIYDDLRIRDKWLKHLDWLNQYLEIKTIKKQEFDLWLKQN